MIIRTSESWAVKDYSFKFKILDLKYFKVKVNSYGFEYNDDATFKLWLDVDIFDVDFTLDYFTKIIKSKDTLVAPFLLKQEIFSGIGNYIKNEVLYMGKLKVTVKTSELTDEQIDKLYLDILLVGYSNLIEMLTDSKIVKYLDKSKTTYMPKKLEIPYEYKIYSREFTLDGKKVLKIKVAGRDTYCIKELC